MKRFLLFLFCMAVCSLAWANEIAGVRAGVQSDKTRIVFDLTQTPDYSIVMLGPYTVALEVRNVSNTAKLPKIGRNLGKIIERVDVTSSGSTARYSFLLKWDVSPVHDKLAPQANYRHHRIYLDFLNSRIAGAPRGNGPARENSNRNSGRSDGGQSQASSPSAGAAGSAAGVTVLTPEEARKKQAEMHRENLRHLEEQEKARQEAKLKAERDAKLKAEQEAKLKAERDAKLKAERDAKLKAEQEAKLKSERDANLKAEQEAKLKAERDAKLKAERDAKLKAEQEAKLKAERDAKLKAEQEAKLKAERDAKLKAEQEAKLKAERDAKLKAEREAKLKAEQEAKRAADTARARDEGIAADTGCKKGKIIIAIDAGHGGKDPGAIGAKSHTEKSVTLAISRRLAKLINSSKSMKAVMIRNSDVFVDLDERSRRARRSKAEILISIHADAAENKTAKGASVLVLNNNRASRENQKMVGSEDQEKLLSGAGTVIDRASANGEGTESIFKTFIDMTSNHSREYSYHLAERIIANLSKFARMHKHAPDERSLAVLKAPDIPSILVETGFISNPDEEKLLTSAAYQTKVADAIYQAILEHNTDPRYKCRK